MWLPSFDVCISPQYQPLAMSQKLWQGLISAPQYLFSPSSMARDCSEKHFPASLQINMTHVIKFGPIIQKWKDHTVAPGTLRDSRCMSFMMFFVPPSNMLFGAPPWTITPGVGRARKSHSSNPDDWLCLQEDQIDLCYLGSLSKNLVLTTTDFKATGS